MQQIEYWFDKNKLGGSTDVAPIKQKFRQMMFSNGVLTQRGEEVWNVISGRSSILEELDVQTKSEFISHISILSNKFYDFIQVK